MGSYAQHFNGAMACIHCGDLGERGCSVCHNITLDKRGSYYANRFSHSWGLYFVIMELGKGDPGEDREEKKEREREREEERERKR